MSYAAQLAVNASYVLLGGDTPSLNTILPNGNLVFSGNGYLGGDFPDYVTKVEGVPAQTEIIIFEHDTGELVRRLITEVTGSWRVNHLNPDLFYDVVCRYQGYKDEIVSNVKPFVE